MTAPAYGPAIGRERWPRPRGLLAGAVLGAIVLASVFAPLLAAHDPTYLAPSKRLQLPGAEFLLGSDAYGRDLWARMLFGGRISLVIGIGASALAAAAGLAFGLVAGAYRHLDQLIMRAADGLMAIPSILLAIAVVAVWGGSPGAVLIAITIPEVPRVTRVVRSIVVAVREEPFVDAARSLGTSNARILTRHLLPATFGPLVVLGTYVCASAILLESMLSFLGAGINPETPTWGNIIADGRLYIQLRPGMILWPGLALSATVLSINMLGDALRDRLDPRARYEALVR